MFRRGSGVTSNKFSKDGDGNSVTILEIGNAPHQWTIKELKEILEFFEKPADKEVKDDVTPNAKRGPGRPRKVGPKDSTAGEVSEGRA